MSLALFYFTTLFFAQRSLVVDIFNGNKIFILLIQKNYSMKQKKESKKNLLSKETFKPPFTSVNSF